MRHFGAPLLGSEQSRFGEGVARGFNNGCALGVVHIAAKSPKLGNGEAVVRLPVEAQADIWLSVCFTAVWP